MDVLVLCEGCLSESLSDMELRLHGYTVFPLARKIQLQMIHCIYILYRFVRRCEIENLEALRKLST